MSLKIQNFSNCVVHMFENAKIMFVHSTFLSDSNNKCCNLCRHGDDVEQICEHILSCFVHTKLLLFWRCSQFVTEGALLSGFVMHQPTFLFLHNHQLCYFHSYLRHIQLGHLLLKSLRCRCNKVVLIFFESIEIQMWHSPLTCFQQKSSIHRRLSVDKILQTQDPGHRSTYWPCLI